MSVLTDASELMLMMERPRWRVIACAAGGQPGRAFQVTPTHLVEQCLGGVQQRRCQRAHPALLIRPRGDPTRPVAAATTWSSDAQSPTCRQGSGSPQ